MAGQLEIPLPEIAKEDFKRSWARFELVAMAKEWDADRQRAIIPTLLRGKLFNVYIELPEDTKEDLQKLKGALAEQAGRGVGSTAAGAAMAAALFHPRTYVYN